MLLGSTWGTLGPSWLAGWLAGKAEAEGAGAEGAEAEEAEVEEAEAEGAEAGDAGDEGEAWEDEGSGTLRQG